MGVTTITQEFTTSTPPSKMFKALILDSHNLIPKLMPQSIKSIEFVEGDGGVGSIKQTNFPEGSHFKYLKHKIDALDTANFMCKYTLIEGDVLGDKLESVVYEVKFVASGSGSGSGSVCKMTSHYNTKGDINLKEEEIKAGKDKAIGMYKVVEEYLLANPETRKMGVISFAQEYESPIDPGRLFKALIVDSHNLCPKLMSQSINSIEIIDGDGDVGSIKQINFAQGIHFKHAKFRMDELDTKNYRCKYTIVEGDVLGEKLKSIKYEVKFVADEHGGCICKMLSEYYSDQEIEFKDEDIEFGKERATEMYKVVEAYLLTNPHTYV